MVRAVMTSVDLREVSWSVAYLDVIASRMEEDGANLRRLGNYEGVFSTYAAAQEGDVVWDCAALAEALEGAEIPKGVHVLELCCGDGRVGRYLASLGWKVSGVDASKEAIERAGAEEGFTAHWADVTKSEVAEVVESDACAGVLSAGSLNCFVEGEEVLRVLDSAFSALSEPPRTLFLFAYADDAISQLAEAFQDQMFPERLETAEGEQVLVWTTLGFHEESQTLHQPALCPSVREGRLEYDYTYYLEKMWTVGDFRGLLGARGYELVEEDVVSVEAGMTGGLRFVLLSVRKERA